MAKEEKAKPEPADGSDYEFVPPGFDEDAFIHKEVTAFRSTTILVLWGVVAALVGFAIFAFMGGKPNAWWVCLAVAAAMGVGLKWLLPALKADVRHYKRKEWVGTGFLFFFTFLSILILLVNPPFSDFAGPQVASYPQPAVQQQGSPVVLHVFAADNKDVDALRFTLNEGNELVATQDNLVEDGPGHWTFTLPATADAGVYKWTINATDGNGRSAEGDGRLEVRSDLLRFDGEGKLLTESSGFVSATLSDKAADARPCTKRLVQAAKPCVRLVQLVHVQPDGTPLADATPVILEYTDKSDNWRADFFHAGWRSGNNTVKVQAVYADRFHGGERIEGATIELAGPFRITVDGDGGDHVPKVHGDPKAPARQVPGIGLPALAAGLVVVAFVARRKLA